MPQRRHVLIGLGAAGAAAGLGVWAFERDGVVEERTASQARAEGFPYRTLVADEVRTLEALGDVLLPGAKEAGVAHFVDHHLSVPAAESLLMIRYMDVPPPYAGFYQAGLAALDTLARARHRQPFARLPAAYATDLAREISTLGPGPTGWRGPPASLFYFVTRSDAVDVVYGTQEGFAKLGVPYMAHLVPDPKW